MIMVKTKQDVKEVIPRIKRTKVKPVGYWVSKFTNDNECPALVKRRWGNYIPYTVKDVIPRYRDADGLWRRVEDPMMISGEFSTDQVGDYVLWKANRVYISFKCLDNGKVKID